MADESGGQARGIGARLKAARERMRLTVLLAAERLHVDPKVLEALEAERFEELGVPVFVRGHIRRYAELVGESAQELLELYATVAPTEFPDLTRIPKAQRPPDTRKLTGPAVAVIVGFAIMGAVWWVLQMEPAGKSESAGPSLTAPSARSDAQTGESVQTQAEVQPEAASASVGPAAAAQAIADGIEAAVGSGSGAPAAQPAIATRPVQIGLKFSADCWVEVYDAHGRQLVFGIGAAETSRRVTGTPPLRVLLGNAPAVELDIDGQATEIPRFAFIRRDVAQFDIDHDGRIVRASPQTNGG